MTTKEYRCKQGEKLFWSPYNFYLNNCFVVSPLRENKNKEYYYYVLKYEYYFLECSRDFVECYPADTGRYREAVKDVFVSGQTIKVGGGV